MACKADRAINFDWNSLARHKWNKNNPPAKVFWTDPYGPWSHIVNIRITKKPTRNSGGEDIVGHNAEMNIQTRYAAIHTAADGVAASEAEFDCCCGR